MALTLTADDLAAAIAGPGQTVPAARLLTVADAVIEGYAPGAPSAIKNEAAIRFCGYLAASDFGGVVSESLGPRSTTWATGHADMFRRCGAASLLSPWRVRRAGLAG